MHSVSDLTTSSRKTSGTIPPKLVGASTTIVGDKMYLFGGRLVAERRMVSDLYVFDLETFVWAKVPPHSGDDVPGARYFHSADTWQNYLLIFGGMGHKPDAASSDDLVVLNDVRFFDLSTYRWLPAEPHSPAIEVGGVDPIDPVAATNENRNKFVPRARYAHLSAVSGSRLYVIGGQDLQNAWLDDICVYDLRERRWAVRRPYPRHAGTYRSVAVAAQLRVRDPSHDGAEDRTAHNVDSGLGPLGGRFNVDKRPPSAKGEFTPSENLVHLPYSTEPSDEFPNDIYLYSNYNFTDVKRELEVFTPKASSAGDFDVTDRSASMTGTVLPPGLRFPTGAICGNHLIFAGTYLAHSYQSYSIWALDLTTMAWSRLDPGAALSTGSWFRAALWNSPAKGTSSLLIFGNRQGSLVEDYNRRLLAWDDVAVLDLEAFGIYQPPPRKLDQRSQELGLAALEEGLLADFEVVCDDGRRIPCSRRLLESRWAWFRDQRRLLRDQANRVISASQELSASANAAPPLPPDGELTPQPVPLSLGQQPDPRPDPRMTPRALLLGEPYAVAMALLQYFYTLSLLTPLQHAPAVLSQLLLLGSAYNLPHLQQLVRHAMHRALAPSTSVGVYEVATLCGCQSLQIRALKAVMASSRRNTGRARGTSNAGGGSDGPPPRGGGGGPSDRDQSNSDAQGTAARLRGMSDIRGFNYTPYSGTGAGGGIVREGELGKAGPGLSAGMGMTANARTNGVRSPSGANREAMWPEDVHPDGDDDLSGDGDIVDESELNGKEVEDSSEGGAGETGENRSATATPTAASVATTRRTRIKHSVNLSMDSIYMALQAAEANGNSSDADADQLDSSIDPDPPPFSIPATVSVPLSSRTRPSTSPSAFNPVSRSPKEGIWDELRQRAEKGKVGKAEREGQSSKKDLETASVGSSGSRVRRRAYTALADLAIPQVPKPPPSPSTRSDNPSPRSSLVVTTASMYASRSTPSPSESENAATPMPYTPKHGLVRQNSLTASDPGWVGGSMSSRSPRPSPLTPDSPPLPTPGGSHEASKHASVSSCAISDEEALYEVRQRNGNRFLAFSSPPLLSPTASSMRNAASQDSHTSTISVQSVSTPQSTSFHQANAQQVQPDGRMNGQKNDYGRREQVQHVDIVEPESDGQTEWADLRIPSRGTVAEESKMPQLQQRNQHHGPSPPTALPSLPGVALQSTPNSSSTIASVKPGLSSLPPEKRTSGSSPTPPTGGFLSKARFKSKKKDHHASFPNGSPQSPSFGASVRGSISMTNMDNASVASGWADTRDVKKAAKAEEKRRKKAEEKARLEALAAQFSQQRTSKEHKDESSAVSTNSSERRRAANEWVEDSSGMYGAGGVAVWGGL